MAKSSSPDSVKVRVLTACHLGNANDVVTLDVMSAQAAHDDGLADSAPAAVAYAESIAQSAGGV